MAHTLRSLSSVALGVALVTLAACAPPKPAVAPVYAATDEGPRYAPWLGLTDDQQAQMTAQVAELKRTVKPVRSAAESLAEAMITNLRRCRNDSPSMNLRADLLVSAGEAARDPVLDAVNDLHAILTPVQRRRLVDHLLDEDRRTARREREDEGEDRAASIGADFDLSWGQIGAMLLRLRKLQSVYEDRAEAWIARYREAVRAFAEPDFDIRRHAIAEVPAVRLAVDAVTDGFRIIIPLLEPQQCEAIAAELDRKMVEAKGRARRREAGQSRDEARANPPRR